MKYFIYILYSLKLDKYYIGHTNNIEQRLEQHRNGRSKSTKKSNDWKVKYTEEFKSRSEAMQRELQIKKKKSRRYIEFLING